MANQLGRNAVVIGGSMAGLMTARVLADHFEQVTIIERDEIGEQPVIHKSIPQGNHVHSLMLGGQQVMSALYPDFTEKLRGLGAVRMRAGIDVAVLLPGGKAWSLSGTVKEPRDLGFDIHCQSRGLLEYCVRQCTLEFSNVRFAKAHAVQELVCENGRVLGVRTNHDGRTESLAADLVVDAGGRGSHAPRWLAEFGFGTPEESAIGVDFAYASTKFRIPGYNGEPERMVLVVAPPPQSPKAALMMQIENDIWHLTLAGRFGDFPPSDEAGFMAFAKSLHTPRLYDIIKGAERVAEITQYRFPTSVLRHYERLAAFPERFLVLGDAIASFNPIYGQGMSSAALQVKALRQLMAERVSSGARGLEGLAAPFFSKAAEVVSTPWVLTAGFDFAHPKTKGERPPNFREGVVYFAALDALTADDLEVHRIVTEVVNLARPLSELFSEPLRSRVLAKMEERRAKA